jgi:hypothetical protein
MASALRENATDYEDLSTGLNKCSSRKLHTVLESWKDIRLSIIN